MKSKTIEFKHYAKAIVQVLDEFRQELHVEIGKASLLPAVEPNRTNLARLHRIRTAAENLANALRGAY